MKFSMHWSCLLLVFLAVGCSSARNTPEQVLEDLRTALKEQKWELLWDMLAQEQQQNIESQFVQIDNNLKMIAQTQGEEVVDQLLERDFGVTRDEWANMSAKDRFIAQFNSNGLSQLRSMGVNPDYIVGSTVKSVDVRGDRATIKLDDGKGHRPDLTFVLVDGVWRYDLGQG